MTARPGFRNLNIDPPGDVATWGAAFWSATGTYASFTPANVNDASLAAAFLTMNPNTTAYVVFTPPSPMAVFEFQMWGSGLKAKSTTTWPAGRFAVNGTVSVAFPDRLNDGEINVAALVTANGGTGTAYIEFRSGASLAVREFQFTGVNAVFSFYTLSVQYWSGSAWVDVGASTVVTNYGSNYPVGPMGTQTWSLMVPEGAGTHDTWRCTLAYPSASGGFSVTECWPRFYPAIFNVVLSVEYFAGGTWHDAGATLNVSSYADASVFTLGVPMGVGVQSAWRIKVVNGAETTPSLTEISPRLYH